MRWRPPVLERAGRESATLTSLAYVGVGFSGFVLIATGSRLLPTDAFSGVLVAWTISNLFGFGLCVPTELLMARRIGVSSRATGRRPVYLLAGGAVVLLALVTLIYGGGDASAGFRLLLPTVTVSVVGWLLLVPTRSALAGRGDLTSYAWVLGTEAAMRLGILALMWVLPAKQLIAAAAVCAPAVVSAVVAAALARTVLDPHEPPPGTRGGDAEHLGFVAMFAGYQFTLQGVILLLEWRVGPGGRGLVGAFGAANSYFRVPTVLTGGLTTHVLVVASRAYGRGRLDVVRHHLATDVRRGLVLSGGATLALGATAPLALPLYYGRPVGLPWTLLLALGLATVCSTAAVLVSLVLLACGRPGAGAATWAVSTVLTGAVFLVAEPPDLLSALAVVVGPVAALVFGLTAARRLRIEPSSGPVPVHDA